MSLKRTVTQSGIVLSIEWQAHEGVIKSWFVYLWKSLCKCGVRATFIQKLLSSHQWNSQRNRQQSIYGLFKHSLEKLVFRIVWRCVYLFTQWRMLEQWRRREQLATRAIKRDAQHHGFPDPSDNSIFASCSTNETLSECEIQIFLEDRSKELEIPLRSDKKRWCTPVDLVNWSMLTGNFTSQSCYSISVTLYITNVLFLSTQSSGESASV